MVTINPKALTLGELYGQFDANTAEWTDGILSYAIRNYALQNTEKPTDKHDNEGNDKSKEDLLPNEGLKNFHLRSFLPSFLPSLDQPILNLVAFLLFSFQ